MNDRIQKEQTLPADFTSLLREMRADRDPRFNATLAAAYLNGWTYQSMGVALGVSRQAVQQAIARNGVDAPGQIPDVPLPPRKPQPEPKEPRRRLLVNDELAEQLREMQCIAAKVNGRTPADAPERRVSVELSARLHALVEQGVATKHLADVLGIYHSAVIQRLARHGYRQAYPSQSQATYKGSPPERATECRKGHPLSGENLYVVPKSGARQCRACRLERQRASHQRAGGGAS